MGRAKCGEVCIADVLAKSVDQDAHISLCGIQMVGKSIPDEHVSWSVTPVEFGTRLRVRYLNLGSPGLFRFELFLEWSSGNEVTQSRLRFFGCQLP
jgi:hypothetical protein